MNLALVPDRIGHAVGLQRSRRLARDRALLVEHSIAGEHFAKDLAMSLHGMSEPGFSLIKAQQDRLSEHAAVLRAGSCVPIGSAEFLRACMRAAGIVEPYWQRRPKSMASHMRPQSLCVTINTEWRYYVLNGTILGYAPNQPLGQACPPQPGEVGSIIAAAPRRGAFALDVAVMHDGSVALSSVLDAWMADYYPFGRWRPGPLEYLQFLWWRWSELLEASATGVRSAWMETSASDPMWWEVDSSLFECDEVPHGHVKSRRMDAPAKW
jgi:hypothetical protein